MQKIDRRSAKVVLLILMLGISPWIAQAQTNEKPDERESSNHHFTHGSIELSAGKMDPRGDLRGVYNPGFILGLNVGLRFKRFVQLDVGFDYGFRAAGVSRNIDVQIENTQVPFGSRRVRDRELFLPVGGRLVLPLAGERVLVSAGGGFSYLRYFETAIGEHTSQVREVVRCSSCGSRSGWGPYQIAQLQIALDKQKRWGFGFTAKYFQVPTNGSPVGGSLAGSSQDRWLNLGTTLFVRF